VTPIVIGVIVVAAAVPVLIDLWQRRYGDREALNRRARRLAWFPALAYFGGSWCTFEDALWLAFVLYGVGLYWSLSWLLAMLDREYDEEEVVDVYERRRVGPRHATHFDTEGLDDEPASLRLLGQPDGPGEPPSEGREDRRVVLGERVRAGSRRLEDAPVDRPPGHPAEGEPGRQAQDVRHRQRRDVGGGGHRLSPGTGPDVAAARSRRP
jgi:hypothetical protein